MPFFIANFPIFSGVTPNLLILLKLLNKFPSLEPISTIKSVGLRLINLLHSLDNSEKFSLKILVVLLV